MSLSLLIIDPDGHAKQWPIRPGKLRLGRGKANDLIIVGRGVSRNHAILTLADDTVQIEDQDSTYGTKLNGRQIRSATLKTGDHVDIGVFRLILVPGADLVEPTSGQSARGRRDDYLTEPPSAGHGRFDEITTGVVTTNGEFSTHAEPTRTHPGAQPQRSRPAAYISEPSMPTPLQQVRDSELNVRFVRGAFVPQSQAIAFPQPGEASVGSAMVSRVEHLRQTLASEGQTDGPSRSSDLASLLLVYRAAELMPVVANLGEYLDRVLDLLVKQLGITTAVLVRRTEIGQLRAVSVRHQDPLSKGEIPVSRAVVDKAFETGQPVFSSDLRTDPSFGHRDSVMAYQVGALLTVPLMLQDKPVGALYLSRGAGSSFDRPETETVLGISALLAKAVSLQKLEADTTEVQVRCKMLERFHAPEVLEVLYGPREAVTELQKIKATVLHLEIGHFAELVAHLDDQGLVETTVAFRSIIHEAVFGNGGTIVRLDEQSGLAVFGGQSTAESDAAWALSAANEMLREWRALRRQLQLPPQVTLRVGLDRGPVTVGVVGPSDRMLYTALGETVVRAQRACRAIKSDAVLATEATLHQVPNPRGTVQQVEVGDPLLHGAMYEITL